MLDTALPFFDRIRITGNPVCNAASAVVCGQARFTLLTSRLIRLEWATSGRFEDRATFAFPNRFADVPAFSTEIHDSRFQIKTENLTLEYLDDGQPFHDQNLSISLRVGETDVKWTPGLTNFGNLRGTRRTVDQCADAASLEEGLLSREGWTVFDDSGSVVWDVEQVWVEARPDEHLQDWYFFGYGHDYKRQLKEYIQFGGAIPLVPRYVLGNWWSRFWAYHADDLKALVNDFQAHEIPLDVLVVDMDWHTPDGWTGYTWNRELFPDPEAFLKWVHDQHLYATLNLHPAEGVQKHEEAYPTFAKLLGRDPSTGEGIEFDSTDKAFIQHYFELLHHPMEDQGVDFWWVDWQQGTFAKIKNLDPLPWLNHLHFRDAVRRGSRPMLYSRWGGLGNHRYPIGFSGDAYTTWESLAFQPYFTATAANVCYGWWSHDIGGHFGPAEPELYARWVQFGAVSPCLRLHSTKDPLAERRPWGFPEPAYEAAKAAMQFRYQLFPYLYSAARAATQEGLSLCYPMYYDYPETEDAYLARGQYFLGDQLIAAPIVSPTDPETGLATYDVWIPEGTWFEYTTMESFTGPRWVRLTGDLNHIPLFAKAGAIVPLSPTIMRTQEFDGSYIILNIFPGADGHFELYEDDGTTEAYQRGEYETTAISLASGEDGQIRVSITASEGHYSQLPTHRTFEVRLRGAGQPQQVKVNETEHTDWSFDPNTRDLTIFIRDVSRKTGLDIVVDPEAQPQQIAPARQDAPFVHILDYTTYEDARLQFGTIILVPPTDGSAFDVKIEWTLEKDGEVTSIALSSLHNCYDEQIFHSPFHDEGDFRSFRWSVSVNIHWQGQTIPYGYQSKDAYPSLTHWQKLIYNPETQQPTIADVLSPDGSLNAALDWSDASQKVNDNLKQPYGLVLLEEQRQRILSGEPLEACAVATIVSKTAQEAVLHFRWVGETKCYLNGVELTPVAPIEHAPLAPIFYSWMPPKEAYYPLSLQAGDNQLIVFTRPNRTIGWWGIGGTLYDQAGKVLV